MLYCIWQVWHAIWSKIICIATSQWSSPSATLLYKTNLMMFSVALRKRFTFPSDMLKKCKWIEGVWKAQEILVRYGGEEWKCNKGQILMLWADVWYLIMHHESWWPNQGLFTCTILFLTFTQHSLFYRSDLNLYCIMQPRCHVCFVGKGKLHSYPMVLILILMK